MSVATNAMPVASNAAGRVGEIHDKVEGQGATRADFLQKPQVGEPL